MFILKTNENFVNVCLGVSDVFQNNQNKEICFKMNQNKPKMALKISKALKNTLFPAAVYKTNRNKTKNGSKNKIKTKKRAQVSLDHLGLNINAINLRIVGYIIVYNL